MKYKRFATTVFKELAILDQDLKTSILSLLKLQEIDASLFKINEEMNTPPEEQSQAEAQLRDAERRLKMAERAFRDVDRERRSFELRHITLQEDLKKAEAKVREVRNTKEDFSAGKELENFKFKLTDLQKLLAEKEVVAGQKKEAVETVKKESEELQAKVAGFTDARASRLKELEDQKKEFEAKRKEHTSRVTDDIFTLYERIQKLRRGSGIAVVKEGVCTGCFVSIPPQTRSKLRKLEEMITCSSCSRILFPVEELGEETLSQQSSTETEQDEKEKLVNSGNT